MSACWVSERVTRATVFACLALGATLGGGTAWAARGADSVGAASRVTISDDGITIRRDARTLVGGRHVRATILTSDAGDSSESHVTRGGRVRIGGGSISVDGGDAGVVRMFSDVTVGPGERVEGDVVALFGSVDVQGQIDGNVVAVMGSIRLAPGAVIDGDAVAVGGGLDQQPGAKVSGESVSLHFLPIVPGVPPLRALMLLVLACWLFAVIAGGLLWLVMPRRMVRIAETAVERTGWSLMVGLLLPPFAVILGVLLLITVIGIPVAFLLPIVYLIVVWAGQVAMSYLVGCRLLRRPLGDGGALVPTLVGALLVAALFGVGAMLAGPGGATRTLSLFFTLLGGLFSLVLTVLGSGAAVVSGLGSPARAARVTPAAVVPGSMPVPTSTPSTAAPPVA
jgi:cytoskeletal protein CcmA (bactofilin family)